MVAFILWKIAAGSPQEILVEQFLNPHNADTIRLVASVANQTHLKLFVIDNLTSETTAFIEFENVFKLDRLASGMVSTIGHEAEGNFDSAQQHVMNTMTVPDLFAAGEA